MIKLFKQVLGCYSYWHCNIAPWVIPTLAISLLWHANEGIYVAILLALAASNFFTIFYYSDSYSFFLINALVYMHITVILPQQMFVPFCIPGDAFGNHVVVDYGSNKLIWKLVKHNHDIWIPFQRQWLIVSSIFWKQ